MCPSYRFSTSTTRQHHTYNHTYVESVWLFSIQWCSTSPVTFLLYVCHHPRFDRCSVLEFGASGPLLEQSSSSSSSSSVVNINTFCSGPARVRPVRWFDVPFCGRGTRKCCGFCVICILEVFMCSPVVCNWHCDAKKKTFWCISCEKCASQATLSFFTSGTWCSLPSSGMAQTWGQETS